MLSRGGILLASALFMAVLTVSLVFWTSQTRGKSSHGHSAADDYNYKGTDLGSRLAPDFRLTDQVGRSMALSSFRGSVVVLAFLDPLCTDSCPLTAMHFNLANQSLGKEAPKVAFLAVNVNTKASGVADVQAATEKWGVSLLQNWHFLTGSEQELRPVWDAYNIVAEGPPKPGKPKEQQHTPGIYIVDQAGRQRWYVSVPFESGDFRPLSEILVQHIQALLKDKG